MHLLSWRANGDGFDVALAVNRLLAAGAEAWWLTAPAAPAEPGDYLFDAAPELIARLHALGVAVSPYDRTLPAGATRLTAPAVALFTGDATGYPYWGYYALCLLRLGLPYVPVDGRAIAAGALDAANLFVIPGGFATWGLDAAESAPGADAQVRRFLDRGGRAIGSCGGAFYLSAGRPGWTGTAWAKPRFTHEYLQSGVGIVEIALKRGQLALGLPPTIDMPYYHGPLYEELGDGIEVAGTFRALVAPGRLGIDNPLDEAKFAGSMAGRPAILRADGPRGRAVLFSPHPEMGDLLRKYITLDGYARKYLPIRGFPVLRDTMRHYRTSDSPSFRLVLNAVHDLVGDAGMPAVSPARPDVPDAAAVAAGLRGQLARRAAADDLLAPLVDDVVASLDVRLERAAPRLIREAHRLSAEDRRGLRTLWAHLGAAIEAHARSNAEKTLGQTLMEVELGTCLMETWARCAQFEAAPAEVE
ncbi:MAG TPA: hypothetical protein VHM01_23035 [Alphaproteobacteria bacterium]|nr:hypothetical protein [Alphaproteobacteria bacterium]